MSEYFDDEKFEEYAQLPLHDITEARLVYAELAYSPNSAARREAAFLIGALTEVDHDFGLALWQRLIVDDDPEVMDVAFGRLSDNLYSPESCQRNLGLTWSEAADLINSHQRELMRRVQTGSGTPDQCGVVPLPADLLTDK